MTQGLPNSGYFSHPSLHRNYSFFINTHTYPSSSYLLRILNKHHHSVYSSTVAHFSGLSENVHHSSLNTRYPLLSPPSSPIYPKTHLTHLPTRARIQYTPLKSGETPGPATAQDESPGRTSGEFLATRSVSFLNVSFLFFCLSLSTSTSTTTTQLMKSLCLLWGVLYLVSWRSLGFIFTVY